MAKRRLPLISTKAADEDPPRPTWIAVGFGALVAYALWIPLSVVGLKLAKSLLAGLESGVAGGLRALLLLTGPTLGGLAAGALLHPMGKVQAPKRAWQTGWVVALPLLLFLPIMPNHRGLFALTAGLLALWIGAFCRLGVRLGRWLSERKE